MSQFRAAAIGVLVALLTALILIYPVSHVVAGPPSDTTSTIQARLLISVAVLLVIGAGLTAYIICKNFFSRDEPNDHAA
ncbi:hypothetical protein CL628_03210 [bacterium]|nr:hypothetical protein [bacterium]